MAARRAASLATSLREAPALLPALAALALFIAWAANEGGYPPTHWAPGGLILLGLVGTCLWALPLGRLALAGRVALVSLFAYAAWSYLSILWAKEPGAALEGGDRALLYALCFALFACFGLRGRAALAVLVCFALALGGLGLAVLVELATMGRGGLAQALPEGRLVYPAGYVNAAAAQWMVGAFPALLLARERRLGALLRGTLAGAAVVLCALALLSLSRGWLVATVVTVAAVFVLLPSRLRTFVALAAVAVPVAVDLPFLLRVGERAEHGANPHGALVAATVATVGCALAAALLTTAAARFEGTQAFSRARHGLRRVVAACAVVALGAVVVGALAAAGNPIARVEGAWRTFTSPKGYEADNPHVNRLISGFGSNRYDFYRVALRQFLDHPLLGDGSENFLSAYLREGRSGETPRYPHSLELRVLSETGLVGALIAIVGVVGGFGCALAACRRGEPLARAAAAAAFAGFLYFAVHGSVDWFWEYAGLGAPALALLGLACAQAPAPAPGASQLGFARLIALAPLAVGGALAFALPWLSGLQVEAAARVWRSDRASAYNHLSLARSLDPLAVEPQLLAGTIAVRYGELGRAHRQFADALSVYPEELYATLELAGIAAQTGERARAEALLERAVKLDPRGTIARAALSGLRHGERVEARQIEALLLARARAFE